MRPFIVAALVLAPLVARAQGAMTNGVSRVPIHAPRFYGPLFGNASTATALAANGTNCPTGQYAAGVDASGAAEGCGTPTATVAPATSSTLGGVKGGANLTLDPDGTLSLTLGNVTAALGYTPVPPSGTGASGTWGISISGTAATSTSSSSADAAPWTGISGKPSTFPATVPVATATALASAPTACSSPQYARGVAASGNASCAQPAWSELASVPSTFTPAAHTLQSHSDVDATTLSTDDTLVYNAGWKHLSLGSCSGANQALTYNATTHAFGCVTIATYTLPSAAAGALGGVELDTDLGGTAAAPQVVATHLAAALPQAQGGTGAAALTCAAGTVLTSNGTAYSCTTVPWNYEVAGSADYTNATTSFTTIAGSSTGLSWAIGASANQTFYCILVTGASATTLAPQFQLTGPASPTVVSATVLQNVSATADTAPTMKTLAAFSSATAATASPGATKQNVQVYGVIQNGTNAGTVAVQAKASGTGTVTVYRGSSCWVH